MTLGSRCVVCEQELPARRRVASCCVECWKGLPRLDDGRCSLCGLPGAGLSAREGTNCPRCLTKPLETTWIDSWGRYESGLAKVLHAFKFAGHTFMAEPLSDLLADVVHARADRKADVIISVPMYPAKERKRGFNQAELLGRGLSKRVGVRFGDRLLRKVEERQTQSDLNKDARRANVQGTFAASRRVSGLRILIVDDICTTGETLSACAAALRVEGAAEVTAMTVARTP